MAYDDQTVNWSKLDPHTYELMVAVLLCHLNPALKRTDGAGGDGGKDVYFNGPNGLEINELKSFHERLKPKQKKQIKASLARAAALRPYSWCLILPLDFTPPEEEWFRRLIAPYSFACDYLGRTWLHTQMATHPSIPRYFLQGAAKEVTDLLKELSAEQAGLLGGVPDLIARLQRLAARADEIDPHYKILLSLDGNNVGVSLVPRYNGAEIDRPITIATEFCFPTTPDGTAAQVALADAIRFGTPTSIPATFVKNVTVTGGPAGLDGSHGAAELFIQGARVNGPDLVLQVVLLDPAGRHLASLPLTVGPRTVGASGVEAKATDPAGVMTCRFRLDTATGNFNMLYQVSLPPVCLPALAMPTIRFLSQFRAPNSLVVQLSDGTALGPPIALSMAAQLVSDDQLAFFAAFERIQSQTGVFFNLPAEVTQEIYESVIVADRLLRGETLRVTMKGHGGLLHVGDFVAGAQSQGIDVLGGERFTQWLVRDHTVSIGTHELSVGVCTFVFRSVAIANLDGVRAAFMSNPDQVLEFHFVADSTDKGLVRIGEGHASITDPDA